MKFKVALNAGHYLGTLGKNCPRQLDPSMTKEWVLNNRVVTKIQKILELYEDIEVLRVDDPKGLVEQTFTQKRKIVNDWVADLYTGVHHNALGKTFDGGGITAYTTINPSAESVEWRDAFYKSLIAETGLKGNRADPLVERDLKELRYLNCSATLLELGFMDSRVDCPIILTEDFADKAAKAIASEIIKKSGAKEPTVQKPQKTPTETAKTVSINLPIIKRGSRGEAVRSLQTLLNAKGASLEADGSFGPATDKALREFKESRGLDIDGSCGVETWTTLLTKE